MTINWSPTTAEEIDQNVRCLLATAPGSVPLSRAMGTPQNVVDSPQSTAAARLRADVTDAVETYEARAKVDSVTLASNGDGAITATVKWSGNG